MKILGRGRIKGIKLTGATVVLSGGEGKKEREREKNHSTLVTQRRCTSQRRDEKTKIEFSSRGEEKKLTFHCELLGHARRTISRC